MSSFTADHDSRGPSCITETQCPSSRGDEPLIVHLGMQGQFGPNCTTFLLAGGALLPLSSDSPQSQATTASQQTSLLSVMKL